MRRRSEQRERIFSSIRDSASHPTAQEIFESLKPRIPSLSLGNLYRNLKILVEEDRIAIHTFADGVERYDAVTSAHYHFTCTRCGGVSDFSMPVQNRVEKEARRYTKGMITGHTIQFSGLCAACAAREMSSGKTRRNE